MAEVNLYRYRRLVIVVRADPVICGHSVEARNLAEAALLRGFEDVRIVTWPIDRLEASGLPLKPLEHLLPYSPGITVERPGPVGDYRVVDGRYTGGVVGRLVELFTDGVPTVCLSLYLTPHTIAVQEAVTAARRTGLPVDVLTIAEAVGSDITNVVRTAVTEHRYGAAAHVLATYLASDCCLAVSHYTKEVIVAAAEEVDAGLGDLVRRAVRRAGRHLLPCPRRRQLPGPRPAGGPRGPDQAGAARRAVRAVPVPPDRREGGAGPRRGLRAKRHRGQGPPRDSRARPPGGADQGAGGRVAAGRPHLGAHRRR